MASNNSGSIWTGITPSGGGGKGIKSDLSVQGGDYVARCVDFFSFFNSDRRVWTCKFTFTIETGAVSYTHLTLPTNREV